MLSHLRQLVAAKQMYVHVIGAQEEADVTLPACRIFARQNRDAARNRFSQDITPFKPGACKCRLGTDDSYLCE